MVKVCKSFESMDNVMLLNVTDSCKTEKMCNKAVEKKSSYDKTCSYLLYNSKNV